VPKFETRVALELARGIKVFLKVEAGVVPRDGVGKARQRPKVGRAGALDKKALGRAGRRLASEARRRFAGAQRGRKQVPADGRLREVAAAARAEGVRAENIVWIFGSARTGSTWLSRMMGDLGGHAVWREPLVGALFGNLYYDRAEHLIGKQGKHYILGDGYRDSWLGSIRDFVLKEATGRFPEAAGPDKYLVIKEPNGSTGSPLLTEALPESRMILLVRDPRDAVASSMDAKRKGGWQYENRKRLAGGDDGQERTSAVDEDPDTFLRTRAKKYLKGIGLTKQAYDAHEGPKVLVRYEELRADTLGTMKRIYSSLGIPVGDEELARVVEEHSWENIPEEEKGEGKSFRKATPGGWREDLTPEQAKMVERITAPLLEEFYSR
jgi:Sulfotransferase domain